MVGQSCLSNAMSNVNKTRIFGGWGVTSDFLFSGLSETQKDTNIVKIIIL